MKKGVRKGLIITGSVLSCLIVLIVVLSLIPIRSIKNLDGYSRITILNGYNQPMAEREETKKVLNDSIKGVKFSIMRGILEGDLNYAIKNVKEKDKNGDNVKKTLNVSTLKDLKPDENGYLLKFSYIQPRTSASFKDEDGDKILYDNVIVSIPKGNSNIQKIKLYPYLAASMLSDAGNDVPDKDGAVDARFYKIYEFTAKAYTSGFYYDIADVLAGLN